MAATLIEDCIGFLEVINIIFYEIAVIGGKLYQFMSHATAEEMKECKDSTHVKQLDEIRRIRKRYVMYRPNLSPTLIKS